MSKKAFLIILDGWGHGLNPNVSAIAQANTSYIDGLYEEHPHSELVTYGEQVGLPEGQMGNSEVGHLNIGAGRVVYQELARINKEIKEGTFAENAVLKKVLTDAVDKKRTVHLIGLLSDGGVHSHIDHLIALIHLCDQYGIENTRIHAFLDGRDTAPDGGLGYLQNLLDNTKDSNAKLSSVIGRYYAMDRDNRWERTQKAYNLLVKGEADIQSDDVMSSVQSAYDDNITDEFMSAIQIVGHQYNTISEGDLVISFNFRTDRPRQIIDALSQRDMADHAMNKLDVKVCTMTMYDSTFQGIDVVYQKEDIRNTLGEIISGQGLTQLRLAETEKYPHVTFFFSGGREEILEKEVRELVDSPKVATYDLKPDMSAYEITNKADYHIRSSTPPDFIILNYANADMVGHTGDMSAATQAAEVLDACLESLIPIAVRQDYYVVIIADHGNSDIMCNEDGSPHTAHTTNKVPFILIDPSQSIKEVSDGKLADIAPTLLSLMEIDIPSEMDGNILTK